MSMRRWVAHECTIIFQVHILGTEYVFTVVLILRTLKVLYIFLLELG